MEPEENCVEVDWLSDVDGNADPGELIDKKVKKIKIREFNMELFFEDDYHMIVYSSSEGLSIEIYDNTDEAL